MLKSWLQCCISSSANHIHLEHSHKIGERPKSHRLNRHYGLNGKTLNWIQGFLSEREQCVVVNGAHSSWKPVRSGVPQGSVLGPTLFLLYINDIADEVNSTMRLFADDSILYREIKGPKDQEQLQKDLDTVFAWADRWQMSFNASKCQLLTITRKTKPHHHLYTVSNQAIERTSHHKYLGLTISSDLSWKKHVANITSKASSTLGVIRRNLGPCSRNIKLRAYQALVRPQLEYAAAAWNPHAENDIRSLEAIQRQAVRFICGEYGRFTSITPLLSQLDLDLLATRRLMTQCTMFFKIHNQLINLQFPSCVRLLPASGRTSHQLRYIPIQGIRDPYKFSFYVRTIPIWNRLPQAAVDMTSVAAFQTMALPVVRDLKPTATHHRL